MRDLAMSGVSDRPEQEVKVIWQKAPHGGPIPRLGVTPGEEKVVPLNSWDRVSY